MPQKFSVLAGSVLLGTILLFAACRKSAERDLESEEKRMTGTWTVSSLRYVLTDTLGNTLEDSSISNAGTLEFRSASDEGADVFNPVLFEGACTGGELVNYFRGFAAGDATAAGGWALYWDADPAGKRLIIWGIGPSSSWHRTVNLEYDGDGKGSRRMWYVRSQPGGSGRQFFYYDLRK